MGNFTQPSVIIEEEASVDYSNRSPSEKKSGSVRKQDGMRFTFEQAELKDPAPTSPVSPMHPRKLCISDDSRSDSSLSGSVSSKEEKQKPKRGKSFEKDAPGQVIIEADVEESEYDFTQRSNLAVSAQPPSD